jgi:hypothetical protein
LSNNVVRKERMVHNRAVFCQEVLLPGLLALANVV